MEPETWHGDGWDNDHPVRYVRYAPWQLNAMTMFQLRSELETQRAALRALNHVPADAPPERVAISRARAQEAVALLERAISGRAQ